MANISFFFPKRMQGRRWAGTRARVTWESRDAGPGAGEHLRRRAGGAGRGPQAYSDPAVSEVWLQNAGYMWVPFILLSTLAAWFGMDNIRDAQATFRQQAAIFRRKHAWMLGWLYGGTFGILHRFCRGLPDAAGNAVPRLGAAFAMRSSARWSAR